MSGEKSTSTIETGAVSLDGAQPESSANWSNAQAYGLAVLCLVLGLGLGFLLRGSAAKKALDPHAGHEHVNETSATPGAVTPEQLKHMADKTVEPLLEKLKQNPNDPKLLYEVGNAYYATQQFRTAVEYYSKSADAKPEAKVLTQLSNAYHYSGSDDKAIEALNRALKVDPTFANALFNLGMLKWQTKGDTASAIEAWHKLLKTNPDHPNRRQVEVMIKRVQQSKPGLTAKN